MNKKIILSIGASTLLASSLFAFSCQSDIKKGCSQKSEKCNMMKKKGLHHKKDDKIMRMVSMLDLTDKQKTQIKQIMKENKKDTSNIHSAFSNTSFDKERFIKLVNEKKDTRVTRKAELISKVYAVLNSTQKKDLKTMIDMQGIMKKNMMKKGNFNDRNCNGRR